MGKKLFRHTEEIHLFSLDKSDKPLRLVGVKRWMVLGTLSFLVIGIVLWGIFGTISTVVQGEGILYNPEGLYVLHSKVEGQVTRLLGRPKEIIKKGSLLVEIDSSLKELELDELKRELVAQEKLLEEFGEKATILQKKWELIELKNQIQTLEKQLEFQKIEAPRDSVVIQYHTSVSDMVTPMTPLVTMESPPEEGNHYAFYGFISLAQGGDLIKPSMEAKISFSSLGSEKYGLMLGKVENVELVSGETFSLIPSSYLQKSLPDVGPSVLVRIALTPDDKTVSGFAWTSKAGPPFRIPTTSIGKVEILLEKNHPLSLIIPQPKKRS
jgi:multidrug resistance efflux pump